MAIKKLGLLVVAGLSFALSSPSFAGPSGSWTGLYVGAQAGYAWGEDKIMDQEISSGVSDWNDEFDLDGTTGGIYGGYNYQNGPWVFGVEGDAEIADVEGDNPNWPFGDTITAKITSQGSARGRVGYVYNNNVMFYGTGGIAFANIKTRYLSGVAIDSYDQMRSGWTLGAGVEYAFAPNWTARLDYRYADFGRITNHAATTDSGWNYHNDITEQAVRIGVAYKF